MKSSSTDKYVCFKFERKSTFNIVHTKKKNYDTSVNYLFILKKIQPLSFGCIFEKWDLHCLELATINIEQ